MEDKRIPVTIITGFLGAGKTTLVNNIIRKYPLKKFAIIENEFGDIGIDGGLIVGIDENIFELANGCICCSLNDEFYDTLVKLLDSSFDFNHLLVETTGIADPSTIIKAFLSSERIQSHFIIDSVVCLADATYVEDLINEQPEAQMQLALSDKILLNKTDSVQSGYISVLRNRLKMINPMASVFPVSYANIDFANLLDTYSYSSKSTLKTTMGFRVLPHKEKTAAPERSVLIQQEKKNAHLQHEIGTEGFLFSGKIVLDKFSFWIKNFLYFNQKSIFRAKGILNFLETPHSYVFQAVRDKFVFEQNDAIIPESKLVFIGKNIDRHQIETNLLQLVNKETL